MSVLCPSQPREVAPHRASHILGTLMFGSAVCCGMLIARFWWSGTLHFTGLLGNLMLAWIPLGLALAIRRMPDANGTRRLWFWAAIVVWFLFFPNAFYLVTDLIHMKKFGSDGVARWFDMLMTTSFAFGGIFVGTFSLYLMHLLVRARFGWRAGWAFASGMLALGSFGIYLGRALRLNSWDILINPMKLWSEVLALGAPANLKDVTAFTIAFFFFSLAVYAFFVSLARLHETDSPVG